MTELKQAEKSLNRWKRGLPWDRVVKSNKEGEQLMKDLKHLSNLCAATMRIAEEQERELQAFKDAAAAGMETHKGET